jgi:hypothetical protein
MLRVPNNNVKFVRVNKKETKGKNKRTKKNNINYLSQIVRKNIEEKNKILNENTGGGKKQELKNLLSDTEEIERLLSRKGPKQNVPKKQTKKNQDIARLLERMEKKAVLELQEIKVRPDKNLDKEKDVNNDNNSNNNESNNVNFLKKIYERQKIEKENDNVDNKQATLNKKVIPQKKNGTEIGLNIVRTVENNLKDSNAKVVKNKDIISRVAKENKSKITNEQSKIQSNKTNNKTSNKPKRKFVRRSKKVMPKELTNLKKSSKKSIKEYLRYDKRGIKMKKLKKNLTKITKQSKNINLTKKRNNMKNEEEKKLGKETKNLEKGTQNEVNENNKANNLKNKKGEKNTKNGNKKKNINKNKTKKTISSNIKAPKIEKPNYELTYKMLVKNVIKKNKKVEKKNENLTRKELLEKLTKLDLIDPKSKAPLKILQDIYNFHVIINENVSIKK